MKKSISIFGCTGTIGRQMLTLLESSRSHYEVVTLTAQNNLLMLAQNAIKFNAKTVVLGNKTLYPELKRLLQGRSTEILIGTAGLIDACKQPVDISIMAISGFAGLTAITEMLKYCKIMGIANKEPLVCAGKIIMQLSRQYGVEIVPLDSEHHAITKLMKNSPTKNIAKVTITASGGPFFHYTKEQLSCITPAKATSHPVWQMGKKISIDSATMMNKCLELIEAHNLFDIDHNCLGAVIHPQALIHAFIEYHDNTVTALMHNPDMKIVLASIIARPDFESIYHNPMPLHSLSHIEVFEPDHTKHRAFHIAKKALQQGGNAPIVVNAANEFAVELFCRKQIQFTEIIPLIERALDAIPFQKITSIDEVRQCHNTVSTTMHDIIAASQAC